MKKLLTVFVAVAAFTACREKTVLERRFEEEMAVQKTEEGRKFVTFYHRRAVAYEKKQEVFSPLDGIDEFEAWVLADAYRQRVYGICGATDIPKRVEGKWRVPSAVGFPLEMQPPIFIDQ